jgi:MFS family permease
MLDLTFFADMRFTAANGSLVTASFGYTGLLFVLTQLLQFVHEYSPLQVGVRLVPLSILFTVMGFLAPRIADRVGDRRAVTMGLIGFACGLLTMTRLGVDRQYLLLLGGFVLVGFGYGSALAPATDAIMSSVPREKAGLASGTSNTTRQLGTAVGVAVVGSLTQSGYRSEIGRRIADLGLSDASVAASKRSVGSALETAQNLGGTAGRALAEAARASFVHGMRVGLGVAAGVLFAGALVAWRFLPAQGVEPGPDDGPRDFASGRDRNDR